MTSSFSFQVDAKNVTQKHDLNFEIDIFEVPYPLKEWNSYLRACFKDFFFTRSLLNLSYLSLLSIFHVFKFSDFFSDFVEQAPTKIYLFKVNNRNTRKRYEICSKLTIKTLERR